MILNTDKNIINLNKFNEGGVGFTAITSNLNNNVNINRTNFLKNNYGFSANGPDRDGDIYNENNYNRDVDSYADDADALGSVFGGEE